MTASHRCPECTECRIKRNLQATSERDAVLVYCRVGCWEQIDRLFANVRLIGRDCDDYRQFEDALWQDDWTEKKKGVKPYRRA